MHAGSNLCLFVKKQKSKTKQNPKTNRTGTKPNWLHSWGSRVQGRQCCVKWMIIVAELICNKSFSQSLKHKSGDSRQTLCAQSILCQTDNGECNTWHSATPPVKIITYYLTPKNAGAAPEAQGLASVHGHFVVRLALSVERRRNVCDSDSMVKVVFKVSFPLLVACLRYMRSAEIPF